jgi:hypothetical protein
MGTLKTTNIQTITGSGTLTLGTSGETVTIPSGVTVGGGMSNTPVFFVDLGSSAGQTVSAGVQTKIQFTRTIFDPSSVFDVTTNYRFTVPSGFAGKYLFRTTMAVNDNGTGGYTRVTLSTAKNGTVMPYVFDLSVNTLTVTSVFNGVEILDLAVGDYVEFYAIVYNGTTHIISGASGGWSTPAQARTTSVAGYRLIGT